MNDKVLIRVKDVATVRRGYLEPPITKMRFQGQPAIAISVAAKSGGDIAARFRSDRDGDGRLPLEPHLGDRRLQVASPHRRDVFSELINNQCAFLIVLMAGRV